MEYLIAGQVVFDFIIIGCNKYTNDKRYDIKYRCLKCDKVYNTRLLNNKVCILRCETCNKRGYIIPIIDIDNQDIISYRIMDNRQYRIIRKQYKEMNIDGNFIEYVRDYLLNNK